MEHPDNGLLQALLDGEVGGSDADTLRAHLEGCPECRAQKGVLGRASQNTAHALSLLDTEPPFQEARLRFQAQERTHAFARRGRTSRGVFGSHLSLPKAASIALLLTGAAVTALPGSPVRRWMAQGWATITGQASTGFDQVAPSGGGGDQGGPSSEELIPETGASIFASSQGVEIWIHDLPSEAELRVLWTEGEDAWVYAGEGTRFNRDGNRLEAFSPKGAVRIEIPKGLQQVVVGLNGSLLLRKTGGELEILGQVQQRTPSEILFEAPGSPNEGRSQGVFE